MADAARIGSVAGSNPVGGASWLDPGLVMLLAGLDPFVLPVTAGTVVQMLRRDPERVAFIVVRGISLTTFPRIGPGPDVATFGVGPEASAFVRTFVLQDWLSLIAEDWWISPGETGSVKVYEFKAPTFGGKNVPSGH